MLKRLVLATAISLSATGAYAGCAFENQTPIKMLSAGFAAWKAVSGAMAECGNFEAELDQEFREKQPAAFEADPALYQIGGVANSTMVPLLNKRIIRPIDDLVAKHGQHLRPNQLITIDGKIMAVAMMVNAQHLMYREDILADLGIAMPTTYEEVLAAAERIEAAGVVDYPLGGTYKTGWNLAQEFVNMHIGMGGTFIDGGNRPTIDNEMGLAALDMMKRLAAYMDPEYLVSDSTYVQQQFQQGKIAIANLWASRAGAMDDEKESQVVGKVKMAAAPAAVAGGRPASTLWWDGVVFAQHMSDETAEAAFMVAMEGLDREMVEANNDAAVWLIEGFMQSPVSRGASETAANGAVPYPASSAMGLMHTVLGNGLADFLTGAKDAATTLADIESAYLGAAKDAGLL